MDANHCMPNMRKLLPLLILLTLVACDKSGTSSYANTSLKADPALKGIWKLVSVRFAGGNVQDMKTLYAIADSLAGNMYVQSYYEMKLDDKDKISRKEKAISDLASSVSRSNANPGHINVLGFNAMNANTGSVTGLRTYAFAA